MPFEKVETQVDFPAQERAVLEFWDDIERLRDAAAPRTAASRSGRSSTARSPPTTRWASTTPGAAPTRTPTSRYFAMTGHELRYQNGFDCQGLWVEVEVEKELEAARSKRDIENLVPGDPFASIDQVRASCARTASTSSPACRPSSRSASATGWTGTAPTPTGPSRRTSAKSYFTMSEENNYTIWSFLKKCHDRGLDLSRLRRHAVVPALRRRPVARWR